MSATRGLGGPQGPPLGLLGRRILILTAMTEERDAIIRHAEDVRVRGDGHVEARIGSSDVAIAATGSGPRNAKRESARLCEALHPAALLGAGVAAALSRELEIGDLLASRRVRDPSGDLAAPDERLLSRALAAGARPGTFLAVQRPAVTARSRTSSSARSATAPKSRCPITLPRASARTAGSPAAPSSRAPSCIPARFRRSCGCGAA